MSGFDIPGPAPLKPNLIGEPLDGAPRTGGGGDGAGLSFKDALNGALDDVRSLQLDSKAKYDAIARGENVEVHDLMIAVGKSEVAFNLMLEVRNKLLEAWQLLSRSVN
ncbi:MAG: flagellar hook-basal body complex protein FliE [Planctomycetota bacterium]|jgi:flagellar hook-basal body complex protein FliE